MNLQTLAQLEMETWLVQEASWTLCTLGLNHYKMKVTNDMQLKISCCTMQDFYIKNKTKQKYMYRSRTGEMVKIVNDTQTVVNFDVWFRGKRKIIKKWQMWENFSKIIVSLLPDYYDLVVFGIHHFGISSICYGKQMPEGERELSIKYSSSLLFYILICCFSNLFFPFLP